MAFNTDNIGKNCYINISEDENIEDSLYGTIIGYYKNTDKNEEYYFVSINGEVKRIYDDSLVNIIEDGGSVTPGTLIMVSGEMTEEQATQFRENIGAVSIDEIGTIFVLKGSVATVADLPTTGNTVGDVYYVQDVSAGYIWLISDSQPNGYWEELGETFNITIDSELSTTSENPVQNKVISSALAEKGTYSKPSGGIPKSDLASSVQASLGKADTALQVAPVASVNGRTGVVVLGANDVGALPNDTPIPPAVTDQTVSDWGFTKNTGTYSKPSGGIPKSDLASAVQTSLGKADTALQSVPSTYRTASAQDIIDDAQDTAIANKLAINGNAYRTSSIPMGKVDSTSTATEFTATIEGITELRNGVCMWLTNGVITSASGFTININNLGAKPCYSNLATSSQSTTIFNINYTLLMIYNEDRVDGGCWDIVYGIDTNTTYTPYSLGFGYGTSTTAEATIAKVASVSSSYKLVAGGIVSIKFTNDVPANSTLNVNSKGAKAIYYRGAAITDGIIRGGDTATFIYSTYYHLISIDRDEKLPAITTADNGKFLCVINGAWSATTVPSAETASF
jgi:hypothetical protein